MLGKDITAIILTKNEELHIRRCVNNLKPFCGKIYVVDSFSIDATCKIARESGAVVLQNKYINQAQQFQWALDNCQIDTTWVLRMDADEYFTDALIKEISESLPNLSNDITGIYLKRRVRFLGKTLRFGNIRPVRILRLWRTGTAYMEQRWMDEQIVIKSGSTTVLKSYFIDDNLNGLTAWTDKHNNYSNREILTLLDSKYNLFSEGESKDLEARARQKSLYYSLPRFFRAFIYFFIRYVCFLGFLDGIRGFVWLTLQAYWYRFLVDAKIYEMENKLGMNPKREDLIEYISKYFGIHIENTL